MDDTKKTSVFVCEPQLGGSGPTLAVKDCIDIAGWPTRCGSAAFDDAAPASEHAAVVRSVLDAGCRIVGKANMHELAYGMTGINARFGTPVNPLWPDRIPGGSSSGSAVAVAAGMCDFAIGTDTGGSVRQPAICCGIVGIKPTFGRISREGVSPAASSLDCVGALAQNVPMMIRAMEAMDPTFTAMELSDAPRLAAIDLSHRGNCDPVATEAVMRQITVEETVSLASFDAAFQAAMTVIGHETAAAFGHLLDEEAPLGADVRTRLELARNITPQALADAEATRHRFVAEVDAALEKFDALITPAMPFLPPRLADVEDAGRVLELTWFLRPFNLSGHPAIVLPVVDPAAPLPVGLQLVGRRNEDARLCAIAQWLSGIASQVLQFAAWRCHVNGLRLRQWPLTLWHETDLLLPYRFRIAKVSLDGKR